MVIDETDIVERLKLRADSLRSEGQAMRAYLEDQAAAEIARLRAKNERLKAAQTYTYMGEDGKPVLARDLEDDRDRLRAALDAMTAERDENEGAMNVWRRRCYEAEADLDAARAKALEDAAKLVEEEGREARNHPDEAVAESYCDDAAAAIRALITQKDKR